MYSFTRTRIAPVPRKSPSSQVSETSALSWFIESKFSGTDIAISTLDGNKKNALEFMPIIQYVHTCIRRRYGYIQGSIDKR
jgi:hypothetical protein